MQPRYLWFLTLFYAMVTVLANWFDPRLVHIFGLNTDAGTLIFPLTFLLSNLITEVYGYKHARRAIWAGFLFNGIYICYGQLIVHLPSPSYANHNAMFDQVVNFNSRIIVASALSYLSAEPVNSYVVAKLKIKLHGRYMGLRFVLSTFMAALLDSCVFGVLAFAGVLAGPHLLGLILSMWLIKVVIEILGLPLSIRLAKRLKQVEWLDIYDKRTRFSLFSLNTDYTRQDNAMHKDEHVS